MKFLMDTSEVSSVANGLSYIKTSLDSIASTVSGFDVSYKGNADFASAKSKIVNNIKGANSAVDATEKYIASCVTLHEAFQNGTSFYAYCNPETVTPKEGGSSSGSKKSGSSGSGSEAGGSNIDGDVSQTSENAVIGGLIGSIVADIKPYFSESGTLTDEEINSLNSIILFPETGTCIAPIGFAIGNQIEINFTNSELDGRKFTVIKNLANPIATNANGTYNVTVVSTKKENIDNWMVSNGVISLAGVSI